MPEDYTLTPVDHDPFDPRVAISPPGPSDPRTAAAVGRVLFPGVADYLTAERPAPSVTPNAAGKVPSTDPYLGGAIEDVSNAGAYALPGGIAMRAGRYVPQVLGRLAEKTASERGLRSILETGGALAGMTGTAEGADRVAARSPAAAPGPTPTAAVPMPELNAPRQLRPDYTAEDKSRLAEIDQKIATLTKGKQKAVSEVGRSRIATVGQGFEDQIKALQDEKTAIHSRVASAQDLFDKGTLPLAVREADLVNRIRLGALGVSGVTGVLHGAFGHGRGVGPWLGSAAMGAGEAALGVAMPSLFDLGQPVGTAAHDVAERNMRFVSDPNDPSSWDYARHTIAPEAVAGAGLGVVGHGIGRTLRGAVEGIGQGVGRLFSRTGGGPAPTAPAAMIQTTPGGKVWPADRSQIKMMQDKAGRWREQGTGHYIPKHLQPPTP